MGRHNLGALLVVFLWTLTTSISYGKVTETNFLAQKLGLSSSELKKQSRSLALFVLSSRSPKSSICHQKKSANRKVCQLIPHLYKEKSASRSKGFKRAKISFNRRKLPALQRHGYRGLLNSLKGLSTHRVLKYVDRITSVKGCPRNFSAALIRKLEEALPDSKYRNAIHKLYHHSRSCLKPEDKAFSDVHSRMALLYYLWGQKDQAKTAITSAYQAETDHDRDKILYWAGKLDRQNREVYWRELGSQYPLSWHTILAWRTQRTDPFSFFSSRPLLKASDIVLGDHKTQLRAQEALYWLSALFQFNFSQAAERFAFVVSEKFAPFYSTRNFIHIAKKIQTHRPYSSIFRYIYKKSKSKPYLLNSDTLRWLFPKPYEKDFSHASNRADKFLMMGIARQESSFNPKAKSPANARGLMQILPSTAQQYYKKKRPNLYNPQTNIYLGSRYIEYLVKRFGSPEEAIMAYNAGPSRIKPWKRRYPTKSYILMIDLLPFKETRD